MASAEFILAPRIDESKARQEMQKLDDVARRTAQQMNIEFGDAWDNFDRRGKKSLNKLSLDLHGFFSSMAGNLAANAIAKVGEVIIDAATKVFEDAEGFAALGRERYEKNRDINSEADALGIGRGRYAALNIAGASSGLDQSDMRGLLSGFVGALEKPEMAQFKEDAEKNGIDKAFLNFMSAMSRMSPEKAAQHMNDVFGDDDALKGAKFIEPLKKLASKGESFNFQNIVDTMAGRHVDIEKLEKSLNMSEEQMKILFAHDGKALEDQINKTAEQNNAKDIVTSETSTRSVQEAHLDNLHIKVQGQLIADGLEKAEISAGASVVNAMTAEVKRTNELVDAGNGSAFDPEAWSRFTKAFISWTNDDPNAPTPKKGEAAWEYFQRNQDYKNNPLKKSLVDETEEHAERNKNRNDAGPQSMK